VAYYLCTRSEQVPKLKRVFPFDTGAFEAQLYKEFFDKNSQLEDFELDPSLEEVRKFVGTFYQDHKEYFTGMTRKNVSLGTRQFEAQGIYELCRLPGEQRTKYPLGKRDERSSAIEIQISDPISLAGSVIAIIIPEPYLDDPNVKDALSRWDVKAIEVYSTLHNLGGEAWVGQIYAIVRKLYDRLGFFDEAV
jgi:hypothetical protein